MNSPKNAIDELSNELRDGLKGGHKEKLDRLEGKLEDKLTELIKEHPLASVAIAAGLGIIIGRLLSSRK